MEDPQVLIVDDDALSREILLHFFRKAKISGIEAQNGKAAMEILEQNNNISVITLDLNMPIMDGYQFLTAAKELIAERNIKVLVSSCTDHGQFLAEVASKKIDISSVVDYFEKPVHFDNLISKIAELISGDIADKSD